MVHRRAGVLEYLRGGYKRLRRRDATPNPWAEAPRRGDDEKDKHKALTRTHSYSPPRKEHAHTAARHQRKKRGGDSQRSGDEDPNRQRKRRLLRSLRLQGIRLPAQPPG
nr:unnamed protein product [Digitaria exilis]